MYTDVTKFKSDLTSALQSWGEAKIDELFASKPVIKHYAKKGLSNYLAKGKFENMIDNALLFIADSEGRIDSATLFDDALNIFNDMEPVSLGSVTIGKGEIALTVPDNPLWGIVFGNLGKVRLTSEDIVELKALLQ